MKINGYPVVDASTKAVIHITPQDVRRGETKDPAACAAALACKRELEAVEVRVHIGRTYLRIGRKWFRYLTSNPLRTEIIAFDRGGKFAPGEYVLSPCHQSKRATGKRQGGKDSKVKTAARHRPRRYQTVAGVRPHGANR